MYKPVTQLSCMTLNMQYQQSFPGHYSASNPDYDSSNAPPNLTEQEEFLQKKFYDINHPHILGVQECTHMTIEVLSRLGYDLVTDSYSSDTSMSVKDMVYNDNNVKESIYSTTYESHLFNAIFIHREVKLNYNILDKGYSRISSTLNLDGSSGRSSGILAYRSVVWIRIQDKNTGQTYLICNTHISGGRFEDLYFLQLLESGNERTKQIERVIEIANQNKDSDDIIIFMGDFNATPNYTNPSMVSYWKHVISNNEGVRKDAIKFNIKDDTELESKFMEHMIGPLRVLEVKGWYMLYNEEDVGATSAFGHCIDWMASNKPIPVKIKKMILCKQMFDKNAEKPDIVLTDHNPVVIELH